MDKAQILSTLKAKLGNTSLSDRTLDAYISANLPAEGVEPDDAYFDKHKNVLTSLQGQFSHDVATAVENFKKTYTPPTPPIPPTPPTPPTPPANPEMAALIERIKTLEEKSKKDDEAASVEKMRLSVMGKSDELGVTSYKNAWKRAVNDTDLSDCKTDEEALKKVKGEFESFVKEFYGDNAKPYGKTSTTQQTSEAEAEKLRKAYLQQLEADGMIPGAEKN